MKSHLLRLDNRIASRNALKGWRSGFGLLESVIVLIIAIAAMAAGARFYSDYLKNQGDRATAEHMLDVSRAYAKYLQDNYAKVLADATPTGVTETPIDDLIPDYLSTQFVNKNPFGQEYVFSARKPDPTKTSLEAVVYTRGGEEIEPSRALNISQMLGAGGGFTLKGGDRYAVRATFDGFELNLSDYDADPQGTGKLVSALFLNDMGMIATDFLYRNKVPGRPELNQMNTAIDMGGNNLNNAALVSATAVAATGDITSSAGKLAGTLVESTGNVNAAGDISSANGSVRAPNGEVMGGTVNATNDISSANGNINALSGQIHGATVLSDGRVIGQHLQLDGAAERGAWCEGPNLIGIDDNGKVLSCQNNAWRGNEGGLCQDGRVINYGYGPINLTNDSGCEWILFVKRSMNKDAHALIYLNGVLVIDSYEVGYSVADDFTVPVPVGANIQGSWTGMPAIFTLYRD